MEAVLLVALMIGAAPAGQKSAPAPKPLVLPVNGTLRVQMSTKHSIRAVNFANDQMVHVRTIPGETTAVLLIGHQPGKTAVEMTDAAGRKETREVIVEMDAEYLRGAIRNEVPDAKVVPILMSGNKKVVLTGTVARAADAEALCRVVRGLGLGVINSLRTGVPDRKYRLKVTVTESPPGKEGHTAVEPGRLVVAGEVVTVQHRFSDHTSFEATVYVLEQSDQELFVSLEVTSQRIDAAGGRDTNQISTGYAIAPGDVIRVKMAKAGAPGVSLTADIRVEELGKKSGTRVHRLDFVSGRWPAGE